MSGGMLNAIKAVRELLWHNGFRPMPVYNPDHADRERAGKAPLGKDWEKRARQTPPECIAIGSVVAWATNTGILCDGLRAIDLDIDEQPLVALVSQLAVNMLGATIIRTRANSPRCLLVYRAATGEPVKLTLVGASHTKDNSCKIEVLGRGQQFVAYGGHPSGAELQWLEGGPTDRALADLPAVSEDQVHAFLNACVPVIEAKPIGAKPAPKPNGQDHDGPATADIQDVAAAMALIPNANAPDWESWNNVGLAIYAATEGSFAGWKIWSEWSAKNPADDPDYTLERWQHYEKSPPNQTGAGKLFAMVAAVSPGWRQPSKLGKRYTNGEARTPEAPVIPVPVPVPPVDHEEPPPPPPPVEPPGGADGPPEPPDPPDDDEQPPEEWDDIPAPLMEAGALVTEQEAMRLFINIHHEQLRFNHSSGGWLIWQDHFWRPDERKLAFSWALELCRELAKQVKAKDPQKARLVIEKVRFSGAVETGARAMPQVATTQTDWDADPMLLGTPGGILDLKTGILRPGTHADMISRTTSVTPSVMPECPTWLAFLDYAMHGDDQLIRFIQRYFGYCLTGVVIEEVFLFMFGPGGAGKGTMVETIASMLGDYASTVPMEVFTGQSWSPTEYYRANMAGQRLIVANEPERGARWAEAFIKETTGGDMLSGRHPMGRPFRFKPSHKMAMQGNHMPKLKGKSTGMERRLRILPVTRKPVTPDPHLKAKLITEGPGILRWLIEGCLAWQKIGLNPPDAVLAAGSKYFETQDVFSRWIEDKCMLDRYAELQPSALRASYNAWAKANGEDEMDGNAFGEAIDQFECDPPLTRGRSNGKRWIKGIRIMPEKTSDPRYDP
jgi:putative DNA primase/helicase